jgi:hypothetical protein
MRLVFLPVMILPALLAACSSEQPPAAPASSSAAAAATTAAPAATEALAPLFGTWALDPAHCDGPVLKISQARFEGAENGCDITSFTDNGDGAFTATLSCTGEGQTVAEAIVMRPVFAPTGEGIELTYVNRDNLQTTVLRCRAPAAG